MSFPKKELYAEKTPFYYYDLRLLEKTLSILKKSYSNASFRVHYAVKANSNPIILDTVKDYGLGADVVSGGEIDRVIKAGFNPVDIVFAGVGKTDDEIDKALDLGIGCFNVESLPELEVINKLSSRKGCIANVALRVNPNIDAHTHNYITTGLAENKFGINIEQLDEVIDVARKMDNISLSGLHFHIGSQITIAEPFKLLCETINNLQAKYENKGVKFRTINVGGGLGVDYDNPDKHPIPDFATYFGIFEKYLQVREGQTIHFELGRSIVAQCGSLITKVLYVKEGIGKRFVIVDGGMTELIRPALYGAAHKIEKIVDDSESSYDKIIEYDVVGPICESSDVFGKGIQLPEVRRGDLLAIRTAGAYGESMSSCYNCRPLPHCFTL